MKPDIHPLDRLPELPVELFELSGKLDFSETAPVITVKPHSVRTAQSEVGAHLVSRASHDINNYFVWVIYPHLVCYPFPDLVATAKLKMENTKPELQANETDLRAIANARRYYKLSKLAGVDLPTPYGCHVRYGPWAAYVTHTQSCYDGVPDQWQLGAPVVGMEINWSGRWEDIPSVPNLTVVMGSLSLVGHTSECCGGYKWCATTGSCIPKQATCQDNVPI